MESEKLPEPTRLPNFEKHQYPTILEVEGALVDHAEITRRLQMFMDVLPRLKIDYSAVIETKFKDRSSLTRDDFVEVCNRLSLRPEQFMEWDRDVFNQSMEENIKIARLRGSHGEDR